MLLFFIFGYILAIGLHFGHNDNMKLLTEGRWIRKLMADRLNHQIQNESDF